MEDEIIYKKYKLHAKSSQLDGTFEGYASTHSVDSDGEIVDPGAFKRTLEHTKGVFPILWQHQKETPSGWNQEAYEDDHGLFIRAKFLMNCEQGRYAQDFVHTGLEVGGKAGLSIGFRVPQGGSYVKDGVRHFSEIVLMEVSIVTWASNYDSYATATKGAVSFGDLPLASEDTSWDAGAARSALAKWAGGPEEDKINFSKYKRGFLWFDSDKPKLLGSYKLPIATISGGKLVAVPKGIMACAGGHGVDSADIPAGDKTKIKSVINRYYKKMGKDSPFSPDKSQSSEGGPNVTKHSFKSSDFMNQMNLNNDLDEHYDKKWKMERALSQAIGGITEDKEMSKDEKKSAINDCLDDHAKCMKAWHSKYLDITQPDDEDEDEDEKAAKALAVKEGRAVSAATKKLLDKAMGHIKDANGHSGAAMESHDKGLAVLTNLSTGRYFNDVNPPNPVGGGARQGADDDVTSNPVGGGGKGKGLDQSLLGDVLKTLSKITAGK